MENNEMNVYGESMDVTGADESLNANFKNKALYFGLGALSASSIVIGKKIITCIKKKRIKRNQQKMLSPKLEESEVIRDVVEEDQ